MLQNETLGEKFPMIAEIQNKSKSGDRSNEKFNEMLRGCKFDGILALMEIQKTGLGGGASDDPNDVTYVADDALSGFGGDYDYSDYYDDYEETSEEIEATAKDISGDQSKIRQEEISIPERKVTLTLFRIYCFQQSF